VKNSFATIQALTTQTLRTAADLPSAQRALARRIQALAKAHDLLNLRAWTGANLTDVVARALEAFASEQVHVFGEPMEISAKQGLALSLALHELATNATKYGALSAPGGLVTIAWDSQDGWLDLYWQESGGPRISPPNRKGFGSRLLEQLVRSDLGGDVKFDYD